MRINVPRNVLTMWRAIEVAAIFANDSDKEVASFTAYPAKIPAGYAVFERVIQLHRP